MLKAVRQNDIDAVKTYLQHGADPSIEKYAALQVAIRLKNRELVNIFMKYFENDPDYK